ncbi:MAG: pyruvate, water dikinase regulatory protein [Gammaproteobacteria bacterium]|nr:pyruvate, water dikinase regulatory protein [Gammaproteobacteria bacterium]
MTQTRTVFYLSDQTALTAELLGQTLISQFDSIDFITQTLPYIDSEEKAREVVELIERNAQQSGTQPVLISTVVQSEIKAILHNSPALMLDVFEHFISPLELTFDTHSSHRVGKQHSTENKEAYDNRIQAINYALKTDDGLSNKLYSKADIILLGVSRSGKTPTALYLAMQFGILAANYPNTEDDLENYELPTWALQFKDKLFGLKIDAGRLHEIRTQRRANSRYASMEQCEHEVKLIHQLYTREAIPTIDTTNLSVEEIATRIIARTGLKR